MIPYFPKLFKKIKQKHTFLESMLSVSSKREDKLETRFPPAKAIVDGRTVLDKVPNISSIGSSLDNWEELPGIREVKMSYFDPEYVVNPTSQSEKERLENLKNQIAASNEISPLIVVIDKEKYPYILEGGHRFDALKLLGARSFPALVIKDLNSLTESVNIQERNENNTFLESSQNAESHIPKVSQQQAEDKRMFGPVWHGTTSDRKEKIEEEGFKIFIGGEREGNISHGYENSNYYGNIPAPIHHLGYGIYFTTSKAIVKQYNVGSAKGLKTYYLDVPNLETINFGIPKTMMKWWIENGYNYTEMMEKYKDTNKARIEATKNLTNQLKSKYDAVWFKGKGIRRLLDGDQICVFDTKNIYQLDISLSQPWEPGCKVKRKSDNMSGVIRKKRIIDLDTVIPRIEENIKNSVYPNIHKINEILKTYKHMQEIGQPYYFEVKWNKGGTDFNVPFTEMELR